ncbi:MAG: hypothetical protein EON61_20100 [Alphaproteobacteria bacterium]|jgi:hypothetical protein|nr:MAG: hypothetical protein EON61_20100 [Alphaproteobacteria bacterium]
MTAQSAAPVAVVRPAGHWARLAKLLWVNTFVRGFVGGMSALTLFADVIGLQSYEAAHVIHALVVGWSEVARQIGELIGLIPFLPPLSAGVVNTIVFMGTVTIPALFGIRKFWSPVDLPDRPRWLRYVTNWLLPLLLGYLFIFGTIVFQGADIFSLTLKQPVPVSSTILQFISEGQRLSIFFLCVVMQFVIACWLSAFRKGALTLVGLLLAAELLYFAPIAGPFVKTWADGILNAGVP